MNAITLPQFENAILCYTSQREGFVKVLRAVRIVMSSSYTIKSKAGEGRSDGCLSRSVHSRTTHLTSLLLYYKLWGLAHGSTALFPFFNSVTLNETFHNIRPDFESLDKTIWYKTQNCRLWRYQESEVKTPLWTHEIKKKGKP